MEARELKDNLLKTSRKLEVHEAQQSESEAPDCSQPGMELTLPEFGLHNSSYIHC